MKIRSEFVQKWISWYVWSSGILLAISGLAKLFSLIGSPPIMHVADPIFGIPFGMLFLLVGCIELVIGFICLSAKDVILRVGLVVWLATSFAIYRIGLLCIAYAKPCPCLGSLTQSLHISQRAADLAMRFVFGYLLIGSYFSLIAIWKFTKNSTASPSRTSLAQGTQSDI